MTHDGPAFTVCVLGFADYTAQLARCLDSIGRHLPSPAVAEVRIGLNRPSDALQGAALRWALIHRRDAVCCVVRDAGQAKYPTMRRLFHEMNLTTPFVMWFDDDSWVRDGVVDFFGACAAAMRDGVDLAGARYTWPLRPGQPGWIAAQPWHDGRAYTAGQRVPFFQGAWWIARTALLRDYDYPWPALHHNGGDVMLGVLAENRGWNTRVFNPGVAINADDAGVESRAPRRGIDSAPIGVRR